MNGETKSYEIEFLETILGTVCANKDVYTKFIAAKGREINPDADNEVETIEEKEEAGWSIFHKDENGLFLYDYLIRGFLKTALEVCQENGTVKKITAYRKWIDLLCFVHPRRIRFGAMDPDGVLERPIRILTPKGPRVALVRSDFMNAGRHLKFKIEVLKNSKGIDFELIESILPYGEYQGLGQWRK